MIKNELTENPDFTEWDRFAQHEYIRLALEEENAENVIIVKIYLIFSLECLIQQTYGMVMMRISKTKINSVDDCVKFVTYTVYIVVCIDF